MAEPYVDLTYLLAAKQRAKLEDARYLAEHGDTAWHVNDSSWEDYSEGIYFPGIRLTLNEVVTNLDCESNVGLDIAGGTNGTAMLDLIHRGILNRAAVTSYEDLRQSTTVREDSLDLITGNLLSPDTWSKIIHWRKSATPTGLKLAIHEPRDTLQWEEPALYTSATHTIADNLAPGGVFISQVPTSLGQREVSKICRELEQRSDIELTTVSDKHNGYRQALVMKAA
jgi:hypothetical protein